MGGAYVGKRRCKQPDRMIRGGERVAAYYRLPVTMEPPEFDPAWIVADNRRYLVADKPAGLPTQGRRDADYMAFYELLKQHAPGYVGLHHRLDQDTSGLMLFARDRAVNADIGRVFREGLADKRYLAVARGAWPFDEPSALIDAPIGPRREPSGTRQIIDPAGKPARTEIALLAQAEGLLLVAAKPLTGRTHQIRVHLSHCGAPVYGDALYGEPADGGFFLHCAGLAWPASGALPAGRYRSPPPRRWRDALPPAFQDHASLGTGEC